jgi:glycosyltransferase involved in cell wall biosynthesis
MYSDHTGPRSYIRGQTRDRMPRQGIAEIIRHGSNGFLVGPDDERELALALAMLLRDEPRRRNLGGAARDTILERLTLAQQAENLVRIYRESMV